MDRGAQAGINWLAAPNGVRVMLRGEPEFAPASERGPILLLNREGGVQVAADSRENGVIKIAQTPLDLCFGRSIGMEVAGIEKVSLASSQRLQLLGAKIMVPRDRTASRKADKVAGGSQSAPHAPFCHP